VLLPSCSPSSSSRWLQLLSATANHTARLQRLLQQLGKDAATAVAATAAATAAGGMQQQQEGGVAAAVAGLQKAVAEQLSQAVAGVAVRLRDVAECARRAVADALSQASAVAVAAAGDARFRRVSKGCREGARKGGGGGAVVVREGAGLRKRVDVR
jgi:hypothetical protein